MCPCIHSFNMTQLNDLQRWVTYIRNYIFLRNFYYSSVQISTLHWQNLDTFPQYTNLI